MQITLPNLSCPVYKFTFGPEDRCICLVFYMKLQSAPLNTEGPRERNAEAQWWITHFQLEVLSSLFYRESH